ncbi:glycine cleavage system H protein GcvH [Thermoclostridium stercorarium subsp. stercorarium DSM 8532]|jgi:glycine cleavage system H protein|uniref:Glycine cleavage system H protein n=3 Tax=Thermoclostridium stercorarium TaxID=1510 RepID=L7VQY4_THES1|nr:glycine cleavage system protein GcvH [Thermoclostridium stercorarium]AGC67983.1 glycine cleavage system H protein GcvH [Thermoclostridium stercorarium subsp. stercorarium DSM 8532]AGI39018.1 glycine cleavage system H protein [Thermoclostridium stercorarium subsp. stercorarium DSM 8532]ANW98385.1 glycine cleavage system protein H [Thermoclostridium stercorarium subsp. thermolacticum DSM 2910]ANX00921.1 glycine cleavage system protein H [Thermoclostridium stercorarium subsp. leptospartum DSM 9
MKVMQGLKYSKDHEWVKIEGNKAYIGITDYAQHSLGDIVFVEIPEVGKQLNSGDVLSVVESVKAASDVYTPVSGKIVEVNQSLGDSPEKINEDPYGCWIAAIEISNPSEIDTLMEPDDYERFCKEEE